MRYTKTQSLYLSRKGVLPEIVDLFGMATEESQEVEEPEESQEVEEPEGTEIEEQTDEGETEAPPEPAVDDDDIDSIYG